jgi:hypothetical protein
MPRLTAAATRNTGTAREVLTQVPIPRRLLALEGKTPTRLPGSPGGF